MAKATLNAPDLPQSDRLAGPFTFLFTDIEGSTRFWERSPKIASHAIARHDELLREVVTKHGGRVFKSTGDGLCAVFLAAEDAICAAVGMQIAIASEPWPREAPMHVRVALHTGEAEVRDGDYYGQPLNRVSRLLSVGHGGQILLSSATEAAARGRLAKEVLLFDLGSHRLRDIDGAERVFQVVHPSLEGMFPPLRSVEIPPHNLPTHLTTFVGRERERSEVHRFLTTRRLVTLTGAGGSGKTRLALQAAEAYAEEGEAVWLTELAPVSDAALIPESVCASLGINVGTRTATQALLAALEDRRLLLILDNCEHVLGAVTALADALLKGCPELRILATSREGLGLPGETVYRVPSLSVPPISEDPSWVDLLQFESVKLFMDRALALNPGFVVSESCRKHLVEICSRLDGIPLAIELAAARTRALTLEQIAARLSDRFRLLTGGSRSALPRQQTLRAMVDWSYDLLTPEERAMLARLSVFAGGWTLESAEYVCHDGGNDEWLVMDSLSGLVEKSLVVAENRDDGTVRYRLLETVRQYARDRLMERRLEEISPLRDRHADEMSRIVTRLGSMVGSGAGGRALQRLREEHDNVRAAMDWLAESPESAERCLDLVNAFCLYLRTRGHLREGSERTKAALRKAAGTKSRGVVDALCHYGNFSMALGEIEEGRTSFGQALDLSKELEYRAGEAKALMGLGGIAHDYVVDFDRSVELRKSALAIFRELGDAFGEALVFYNLGDVILRHDTRHRPGTWSQEALSDAVGYFEAARQIFNELNHPSYAGYCENGLANVAVASGDAALAKREFVRALQTFVEHGNALWAGAVLKNLARMAQRGSQFELATLLAGASDGQRLSRGFFAPEDERNRWSETLDSLRASVGTQAFDRLYAQGWRTGLQGALEFAKQVDPAPSQGHPAVP